jgi:hypothetical protein
LQSFFCGPAKTGADVQNRINPNIRITKFFAIVSPPFLHL